MTLAHRKRVTVAALVAVILGMTGLAAAAVPLYDLFCRATGYGGTPGIADGALGRASEVRLTVRFNADIDPRLPWAFQPAQRRDEVRLGEARLAFYWAENRSHRPIVGRAVYNVTPFKAGAHFNKIHCFCFEQQVLEPGQKVEMPVSYVIDPALLSDPNAAEVREITLSYTFFVDEEATADLERKRGSTPAS